MPPAYTFRTGRRLGTGFERDRFSGSIDTEKVPHLLPLTRRNGLISPILTEDFKAVHDSVVVQLPSIQIYSTSNSEIAALLTWRGIAIPRLKIASAAGVILAQYLRRFAYGVIEAI
jgi:hypothetical protein